MSLICPILNKKYDNLGSLPTSDTKGGMLENTDEKYNHNTAESFEVLDNQSV